MQVGPPTASQRRGQLEDSLAVAGLPRAGEMAKENGDLQDQAFKRLFALRISLGSCPQPRSLARRAGGCGTGQGSRLSACGG